MWRDFANLAFGTDRRIKLKPDHEGHADPQSARQIVGDVDDGFANIRARNGHDGLSRRDDLADFGTDEGDDAAEIRLQLRVAELFTRLGQV